MRAEWDITTIVWHPTPALSRTYAIADKAGSVHIIDSCTHRQLSKWAWQELAPGTYIISNMGRVPSLRWSPDGSQLAVLANKAAAIITYAQA